MRNIAIFICAIVFATKSHSQVETKKEPSNNDKKMALYLEYSPLLQLVNISSFNAGVEFKRFQIGLNLQLGSHDLSHELTETTFENYGDLHFHHYRSESILFKAFLKESRKGLYAASFMQAIHWDVEDHANGNSEKLTGYYGAFYAGYRWFPFKKYFYLDAGVGTQIIFNNSDTRYAGTSTYNFDKQPFELFADVNVGVRFPLGKK